MKDSPEKADAYYHLTTRVVAGDFLFGDVEKETMRRHLWLVAERCGIEVLTYATPKGTGCFGKVAARSCYHHACAIPA